MVKINNKNIVNIVLTGTKQKKKRHHRTASEDSSNVNLSTNGNDYSKFTNTSNLENEILREQLHNLENPYINRISTPSDKFREDDNFISTQAKDTEEALSYKTNYDEIGGVKKNLFKMSYKDERERLKEEYKRLGGSDPIILNTTRKKTILNAISKLKQRGSTFNFEDVYTDK